VLLHKSFKFVNILNPLDAHIGVRVVLAEALHKELPISFMKQSPQSISMLETIINFYELESSQLMFHLKVVKNMITGWFVCKKSFLVKEGIICEACITLSTLSNVDLYRSSDLFI
jgi:hypothetical protein